MRVVSADTIEVTINKTGFTLGLIGLDAPNKGECYEPQATVYVRKLLRGQAIRVVRDQSDFDSAGRLMRYVYLADGRFLNEAIIKSGYARHVNLPPDQQQTSVLGQAQQTAQSAKAGLWKLCSALSQVTVTGNDTHEPSTSTCLDFNLQLIDKPGPHQAQLSSLPVGSCINLKAGSATGQYTWFPKGSKLHLSDNFIARWSDNAISVYKNPKGEYISDIIEYRPDPQWPDHKQSVSTVDGLVYTDTYVRLNSGTNLFVRNNDGSLTPLVDIAQRISGSTYTKYYYERLGVAWLPVKP